MREIIKKTVLVIFVVTAALAVASVTVIATVMSRNTIYDSTDGRLLPVERAETLAAYFADVGHSIPRRFRVQILWIRNCALPNSETICRWRVIFGRRTAVRSRWWSRTTIRSVS